MLGGIVRGRRTTLRVPTEADLGGFARWSADMRVRSALACAYWEEPAMRATWTERLAKQSESKDSVLWAIDGGGSLVGSCRVDFSGAPAADSFDLTHFTIDPDRWREGLGWDAALTLHRWMFDVVHLRRATVTLSEDNAPAQRIAAKLGYVEYARGTAALYRDGRYVDATQLLMELDTWDERWGGEREYPVPLDPSLED